MPKIDGIVKSHISPPVSEIPVTGVGGDLPARSMAGKGEGEHNLL